MATSKSTARKAPAKKATATVTPVSAWKKANEPVELPSGAFMKIRKVGFQAFIKAGLIPNSLMGTVQSAIDRGKSADLNVGELLQDSKQTQDILDMMDNVIIFVAVDPEVEAAPLSEADRDEETLYVDELEDEDKMFIFGICTGGPRDVETFRKEQAAGLAALQ